MNEDQNEAFQAALEAHQAALEAFGESDQRTVDAMLVVMLLAPDNLFAELEQLAHATHH